MAFLRRGVGLWGFLPSEREVGEEPGEEGDEEQGGQEISGLDLREAEHVEAVATIMTEPQQVRLRDGRVGQDRGQDLREQERSPPGRPGRTRPSTERRCRA